MREYAEDMRRTTILLLGLGTFLGWTSPATGGPPMSGSAVAEAQGQPSPTTERDSLSTIGTDANGSSAGPAISADGRYVAFFSTASNLVVGDTNRVGDVFVRDRQNETNERVSVSSTGAEGNNVSDAPAISADGRFVAFSSSASNLVPGDTNGVRDIFVHDRQTRTTERISLFAPGAQGNNESYNPEISGDGRYVAFISLASNLVPFDTNRMADVFVHDRQTRTMERVSVSSTGAQGWAAEGNGFVLGVAISADGRYVAFDSSAYNLVAGDTNELQDVFVHDRRTGTTERVSVSFNGGEPDSSSVAPAISADGRYVAFTSSADNLATRDRNGANDVFVRDRQGGATERVSVSSAGVEGNRDNLFVTGVAISADGRYVAFQSAANNLVAGDSNDTLDIFVRDRRARTTERVSVSSTGAEADGVSGGSPTMSADGRYVAFYSLASNLVAADSNGFLDIFVRDRGAVSSLLQAPGQAATTVRRFRTSAGPVEAERWVSLVEAARLESVYT